MSDPKGKMKWRVLCRNVADTHRRAEVSQGSNERYLEALAGVAATTTVAELTASWCERAAEPGGRDRKVRALNPLAEEDAALLAVVADPKWSVNGLRNRDLAEALYGAAPADPGERRQRSARVSRLLRLLRAHGIVAKVPKRHLYRVNDTSRDGLSAILAARAANPATLTNAA